MKSYRKSHKYGDVAESVDALDSKSRSQYVSVGSSPTIPTLLHSGSEMSIFQKIINKEIPADIVYEDDISLAFRDIQPQAPIHILIIPKKPIVNIATASKEDKELLGHLLLVAAKIARTENIDEQGYRLVTNINEYGGQSVYHLHIHLLGGRRLSWPPG
jgi:histidine triad (HIT) family protein